MDFHRVCKHFHTLMENTGDTVMKWFSFFVYVMVGMTGTAGLIYQVAWQKYLSRLLGADSIATAIILATFLGGLSLGYYLCGTFSMHVKNQVKAYAMLEGIIGVWGVGFPVLFSLIDSLTHSWSFAFPVLIIVQGMLCSSVLIGLPTICMGGTIPLLTRGLSPNLAEATRVHATVYAANTAGAFVGALLAGFYFIPEYGLPMTVRGAALLNLGTCVFFYLLSRTFRITQFADMETHVRAQYPTSSRFSPALLYGLAFLSGFYVMTLENVLIRIVNFCLGSTAYAFATIVAVFILAIAVGSFVVGRFRTFSGNTLFINQACITLLLCAVYVTLDTWPYWAHVFRIGFQNNMVGFWEYHVLIVAVLIVILIGPGACMGATIPLAFHELKRNLAGTGKHAGLLLAYNTAGNLTGSIIGGILLYYLLNQAQIYLTASFLAACSTCLVGWWLSKRHFLVAVGMATCLLLLIVFTPFYNEQHFWYSTSRIRGPLEYSLDGPETFFQKFYAGIRKKFYHDGPTGTVAVLEYPVDPLFDQTPREIVVNGKSDSSTIGDIYTLKLSAHIPALLAPKREQVLIIGLGTGVTAGEVSLYPDVEQIDIAEISPTVVKALPWFQEFNHRVHTDPRLRIHVGDAFRILGRSRQQWDIIISEPSHPWVAGVDSLYTQEFYQLVRERLTDEGILLQWTHLYATNLEMVGMIVTTARQTFPHCRAFLSNLSDVFIVASKTPLSIDNIRQAERSWEMNTMIRASLEPLNIASVDGILLREVWSPTYLGDHFSDFEIQTMDHPSLHYIAGKAFFTSEDLPQDVLFSSATAPYHDEFLLARKYPDWENFPPSHEVFGTLIQAMFDKQTNSWFSMGYSLDFQAFLTDPERFPFSEEKRQAYRVELMSFLMDRVSEEAWKTIGLEKASFREKAEKLVAHVKQFRNWIVPYRIDGLKTLLREGISRGNDHYERSWCALQLALLLLQEKADPSQVRNLLEYTASVNGGELLVRPEDQHLLDTVTGKLAHATSRDTVK